MKVYWTRDFTGFYPVGTAAVVVATSPEEAAELLNAELVRVRLPGDASAGGMKEVSIGRKHAIVIRDGEY